MTGPAFVRGLDALAALYVEHPSLPPSGALEIDMHRYGQQALAPAEQIRLAVAVIEQMETPKILMRFNRNVDTAWLYVHGNLAGLRVWIKMWANDVCEKRPDARLKRDRFALPPEIVAAVDARAAAKQAEAGQAVES
ncbi:hypothetical protein [Streptosporangium saharense]|uniref:hypothetical protein n=1 Tax=Streptosporangium saharense TaxID=1706840 RepID=UPI00331FE73D